MFLIKLFKTPKLTITKKSITKIFEFFEFMHLIVNNDKLLIKLWLLGNKKMQYLMQKYLKGLVLLYSESSIIWLLKFKNIEYLQVNNTNFIYLKYIPKFIKFLDITFYEIKDDEIKLLSKTLTYLKTNAKNLKNPNLPQNLTSLILSKCQNFTIDFINNLSDKITTLLLDNLTIVNFELKHLINLVSLELKFGEIQTFILENCFDLKNLSLLEIN